jgi:cyclic-di-GMP-binding protein
MFGLGRSRKDPLADARSAERWLVTGLPSDPLNMHEELRALLGTLSGPAARLTPKSLAALFVIDTHAQQLFRALTAQYVGHAGRSAKIERQIWSAIFDLTQAFLTAFATFARVAFDAPGNGKWHDAIPELICRQIVHLGRDAKVRLYRYESWIPGKWVEVHSLIARATSLQIERQPIIVARDRPPTSIEHQFLMILVLQLIDAGNLTAAQIELVWEELDGWCASLRLSLSARTPTSFYVDLASREGLKRRTSGPLEGSVLFIDTQPLHAMLMQSQVALQQIARDKPRSDESKRAAAQLTQLVRFAAKVDPEYKPFARSGERTPTKDSVDAIVGLAKIAAFLREEDRDPNFEMYAGKSYGGALELAVFGRVRNEHDRRIELARHRLSQYAAAGGSWEAKDVSSTGFRLIAPSQAVGAFAIGTLVAIRPHGNKVWTLGIVRRMKRPTADRTEIGLQVVASEIAGVDLVEQRRSAETDYSVDGDGSVVSGRSFVALFLVLRKLDGTAGVKSLMLPVSEYQQGKRLTLVSAKGVYRVILGGAIEQQADWVWTAVEAQELGTQLSTTSGDAGR